MSPASLDELLDLPFSAAREAGEVTLRYFQKDLAVEVKADLSPVTIADRSAGNMFLMLN